MLCVLGQQARTSCGSAMISLLDFLMFVRSSTNMTPSVFTSNTDRDFFWEADELLSRLEMMQIEVRVSHNSIIGGYILFKRSIPIDLSYSWLTVLGVSW